MPGPEGGAFSLFSQGGRWLEVTWWAAGELLRGAVSGSFAHELSHVSQNNVAASEHVVYLCIFQTVRLQLLLPSAV